MPKVTIYLPDDLSARVKAAKISVSPVCQKALETELERHEARRRLVNEMEELEVELWGPNEQRYRATFTGRWLVEPDPDETRTSEEFAPSGGQYDAGAYWGVAVTAKRNIAVYTAHSNEAWAPSLDTFDTLQDAQDDGVPADIIAAAARDLGEDVVVKLDI